MLAFEGDSQVRFFEGNFQAYEADRKERLGRGATSPTGSATRSWCADRAMAAPADRLDPVGRRLTNAYIGRWSGGSRGSSSPGSDPAPGRTLGSTPVCGKRRA
jgi:hypothetical protein